MSGFSPKLKAIESAVEEDSCLCAWKEADSRLQVQIELSQPLIPRWRPPPKPPFALEDILPLKFKDDSPSQSSKSTEDFKMQVPSSIALEPARGKKPLYRCLRSCQY